MMRKTAVVAGAAMFVMGLGGTASADEPVDTVERTLKPVVVVDAPVDDVKLPGDGQVGGGVVGQPRGVTSAVVGYIRIIRTGTPVLPTTTYALFGALADPTQWTCSGGGGTTSYTVTCLPNVLPVNVSYTCQVLHADIAATTVGASGKTAMDCNSDGVPEAQTGQKFGPAGYDFVWATSTMAVTAFTCTLDLAVPDVTAGCGDPGTVGVE